MKAVLKAEQVYFAGAGQMFLSIHAVCKKLSRLGIKTHYVQENTEPVITDKDLLVIGSENDDSLFPLRIAKQAHGLGAKVIHIGPNPSSEIKELCEFMVQIPAWTKDYLKDEGDSEQSTPSFFEQSILLFGDIVAKMINDERGLNTRNLWRYQANSN